MFKVNIRAQSTLYQFYIWRCLVNEKDVKQEIVGGLHCCMDHIKSISWTLIEKEPTEERERNKDDIAHLEYWRNIPSNVSRLMRCAIVISWTKLCVTSSARI